MCARNGERGGWLVGGFILRVVNASRRGLIRFKVEISGILVVSFLCFMNGRLLPCWSSFLVVVF